MLPNILGRSAGIFRCAHRQQRSLFLAGTRSALATCPRPLGLTVAQTVRNVSSSSSSPGDEQTCGSKEINVKEKTTTTATVASTTSSIDTSAKSIQQPKHASCSTEYLPLTTTSTTNELLSKSTTTEQASSTMNDPKEIPNPPSLASSIKTPEEKVSFTPPSVPSASDIGAIAASYYDKAFRFWSERSGTNEIMELKQSVDAAGAAFDLASAEVTTNRRNLDEALRKWERASGQHMQLLQRRESWTAEDAQRFADFVSLEITSRGELETARHGLARSEEILTKSQLDYINKMRRRYHEEQIWQDQWRVLGTYGTWSLIVLNSCVFLGSQYFQRRRERERTETIAQLIKNYSKDIPVQAEEIEKRTEETSEMPTMAPTADEKVETEGTLSEEKDEMDNTPVAMKVEEAQTEPSRSGTKENIEDETKGVQTPESVADYDSSNQWDRAKERVGVFTASAGTVVKRWGHRIRSDSQDLVVSIQNTLPENVAEQMKMPKSISEIDVPSAIIGASVGGIAAVAISIVVCSMSGKTQ